MATASKPTDAAAADAAADAGRVRRASTLAAKWLLLALIFALVTLALVSLRTTLGKAHFALIYLLMVLGASARYGRRTGVAVAVAAFLAFNFFLLPPYYTFVIADPFDWLVLVAFLVTGVVAAEQLNRAQRAAAAANARAAEIDRFAILGADALSVGRAEDAVAAIAGVLQGALRVQACEIFQAMEHREFRLLGRATRHGGAVVEVPAAEREIFPHVLEQGVIAMHGEDGATSLGVPARPLHLALAHTERARAVLLPLTVRSRGVGLIRLFDNAGIALDTSERRFAEALAHYAALAVERVRLSAEAERAEVLREADKLKDALLASVSHDLRTPLTTIRGLAHEMRIDGDERAAIVEQEAERLNHLVSNLLDLSRLDGGAVRVTPAVEAAEDLVAAALQQTRMVLGERLVHAELPPGDVLVGRFDFVHALRSLVNMLTNAHKYAPAGTPIDVRVRHVGNTIAFDVADRGPGVPAAERDRIFEPFYRATGAQPDVGSAGLGLAIARRLAEAQGGTVTYAPRPGGGSVFTLQLPATEMPDTR